MGTTYWKGKACHKGLFSVPEDMLGHHVLQVWLPNWPQGYYDEIWCHCAYWGFLDGKGVAEYLGIFGYIGIFWDMPKASHWTTDVKHTSL